MLGEDKVFAALLIALRAWAVGVLGVSQQEFLSSAGLRHDELEDPDALVAYDSLIGAWAELIRRFPERPLGMEYGQLVDASALGVVGVTILNARDVRAMVERMMRFQRIADPHFEVNLEHGDEVSVITFDHEDRVQALGEIMEMFLTSFIHNTRTCTARAIRPLRVDVAHPRRHPLSVYEEVWGAPVRFEQPKHALWFETELLATPVLSADPAAGRYLERYLESMMPQEDLRIVSSTEELSVRAKVRAHILATLSTGDVDQHSVADALGVSTRTMQRRLGA
ncbi:MAG: AraC family transcriptional regulator [Myxococcota bacterium]